RALTRARYFAPDHDAPSDEKRLAVPSSAVVLTEALRPAEGSAALADPRTHPTRRWHQMKTVQRRLPSRRWLLGGGGGGAAGRAAPAQPAATATPAAAAPAPVIDPGHLYGQLYDRATSAVSRISGADGPPQDPSSPFNLPSTINGWQELLAHWKG